MAGHRDQREKTGTELREERPYRKQEGGGAAAAWAWTPYVSAWLRGSAARSILHELSSPCTMVRSSTTTKGA